MNEWMIVTVIPWSFKPREPNASVLVWVQSLHLSTTLMVPRASTAHSSSSEGQPFSTVPHSRKRSMLMYTMARNSPSPMITTKWWSSFYCRWVEHTAWHVTQLPVDPSRNHSCHFVYPVLSIVMNSSWVVKRGSRLLASLGAWNKPVSWHCLNMMTIPFQRYRDKDKFLF
jgi:hypothetical protein